MSIGIPQPDDNRGMIFRDGDGTKTFMWGVQEPFFKTQPMPLHFGEGKHRITIDPLGPARKWLGRIGRIYALLATPCEAGLGIWVLAFFYGLPVLLLTPITPSPTDYAIIRIGFHHGKKRHSNFDVWDFKFLEQVKKPGVQWVFFELAGLGARALWYIAIADAITAFGINWISAVYQMAGCTGNGHNDVLFSEYAVHDGLISDMVEGYHLPWSLVGGGALGRGGPFMGSAFNGMTVGGGLNISKFEIPGLPEHLQPRMPNISASIKEHDSGDIVANLNLVPGGDSYGGSARVLSDRRGSTYHEYGMWLKGGGDIGAIGRYSGTMSGYATPDYNQLMPFGHASWR